MLVLTPSNVSHRNCRHNLLAVRLLPPLPPAWGRLSEARRGGSVRGGGSPAWRLGQGADCVALSRRLFHCGRFCQQKRWPRWEGIWPSPEMQAPRALVGASTRTGEAWAGPGCSWAPDLGGGSGADPRRAPWSLWGQAAGLQSTDHGGLSTEPDRQLPTRGRCARPRPQEGPSYPHPWRGEGLCVTLEGKHGGTRY